MIKIKSNNAAARALAAKTLLENRLVAAIDRGDYKLADQIAAELERKGWPPTAETIELVRLVVERRNTRRERRAARAVA